MKIPKHINIMGIIYEIKQVPDYKHNGKNLAGQCFDNDCLIMMERDFNQQDKEETLLHESLHAINYRLSLKLTESQIVRLSSALRQVLTANKLFD